METAFINADDKATTMPEDTPLCTDDAFFTYLKLLMTEVRCLCDIGMLGQLMDVVRLCRSTRVCCG